METPQGAAALLRPILGFGVFVMMRRQLLGIRDRVRSARPFEGGPQAALAAS
jgi:hypothetical protein